MSLQIVNFSDEHIPGALELWKRTPGLGLTDSDQPAELKKLLMRNLNLSWVLTEEGAVRGTILVGHDGRRGFLYHLAVDPSCQGGGWGRALLEKALQSLKDEGILEVRIFVKQDNQEGKAFWLHHGWTSREDIGLFAYSQS